MADCQITVCGNLTRVGIAVSRRYQVNGEWEEKTSFFNVSAWDQLGENASASLSKGSRVVVTGRIETREYETKEGEKRTSVDIVADDIGASLRWATAVVERVHREGGSAKAQAKRNPRPDPVYGDEEPF